VTIGSYFISFKFKKYSFYIHVVRNTNKNMEHNSRKLLVISKYYVIVIVIRWTIPQFKWYRFHPKYSDFLTLLRNHIHGLPRRALSVNICVPMRLSHIASVSIFTPPRSSFLWTLNRLKHVISLSHRPEM